MVKGTLAQDMNCIDHFAGLMKDRMAAKAPEKGDEWRRLPVKMLELRLELALDAGNYVDVANYAMMLEAHKAVDKIIPLFGAVRDE